jgi:dTDP-4-dehydrorhamnose reductase
MQTMKRLLVVGGGGMLGHKLWQLARPRMETWATVRTVTPALQGLGVVDADRTVTGVDVTQPGVLDELLARVRPDVVVNCVGIIKQLAEAKDPVTSIAINALHPHLLARACAAHGSRLIHISTDCVFDGAAGGYREDDVTNASDLYGRTKALGEVTGPGCLTLRTSIIGRELSGASGLVEWFLSRRGHTADGYTNAVFSGLTTAELSNVILQLVDEHPDLQGLYHVSAAPIDKYALLTLLDGAYGTGVTITPRDAPVIDRSLDSDRFRRATGLVPPPWEAMVEAMAADPTPYEALRAAR